MFTQSESGSASANIILYCVLIIFFRSKTQLTAELIKEAPCLLAVGCFCIGTNQVDCDAALSKGVIKLKMEVNLNIFFLDFCFQLSFQ